jgi:hypothetical protein
MNIRKKMLVVAITAVSVASLSTAFAAWDDLAGGYGVVSFGSGNPAKIIFLDQVRPAESNLVSAPTGRTTTPMSGIPTPAGSATSTPRRRRRP